MLSLDNTSIRKELYKVTYQSSLIMNQIRNLSPSIPSVVSQQLVVHSVRMKDSKYHAPLNHATMTMAMLITPKTSGINYTQMTKYHYTHNNQQKE